jgi:hypothetical protein
MQVQAEQPKKTSWFEKLRAPWLRVRYGKTVKPQNQQVSNLTLTDDQVMRRREEPITHSFAFPLASGHDGAGEMTGAKR